MNNLKALAKSIPYRLLLNPTVRKLADKLPLFQRFHGGLERTHPFDKIYGVETSGTFPTELIEAGGVSSGEIVGYLGTTPSVTRKALSTLPDIEAYSFVDIGCGKGRALILGSEFPFKEIIGLELSPALVKVARSNIDKVERRFPGRPPVRIVEGNALDHLVLSGKVVFNIYHTLGRELMADLVLKIESALSSTLEHVFFVYQNPLYGSILDGSPALRRWFADTIPWDASDAAFGGGMKDGVAIWQSVRGARPGACPGADREIIIVEDGFVARIAP